MPAPICYQPIGVIHTPYTTLEGMPIQPVGARGVRGRVEIFPEFAPGLRDLAGFSHITLLYHLHRSAGFELIVRPFLDTEPRGLFATRAPRRPNPIGLSTVRLLAVHEQFLEVEGVDMLDGTPLLDLKPYLPEFEPAEEIRRGWLEDAAWKAQSARYDRRFSPGEPPDQAAEP